MILESEAHAIPWTQIFGIFFTVWVVIIVALFVFVPMLMKKAEKKRGH
jgi:hypothetical protein